jgi:hypothetical protein
MTTKKGASNGKLVITSLITAGAIIISGVEPANADYRANNNWQRKKENHEHYREYRQKHRDHDNWRYYSDNRKYQSVTSHRWYAPSSYSIPRLYSWEPAYIQPFPTVMYSRKVNNNCYRR